MRQEMWMDYVAVCTHMTAMVTARLSGAQLEIPSWIELAHPEKHHTDTRSATEIKQGILAMLEGGIS